MARRIGFGILWGIVGYLCGAFVIGAWRAGRTPSGVAS
jgi:hypothetical protein